ncbi:MAG: phospholipase A [Thiotrichales bacterium]|nr:phospholipase A [Thiotrichales bacterium]
MHFLRISLLFFGLFNALSLKAETVSQSVDLTNYTPTTYDICIHNLLLNGEDNLTVGEIRNQCVAAKASEQPLSQRRVSEVLTEKNPFVLTPHRLNYVMLGHTLSSVNQEPFQAQSPNKTLSFKDTEVQFQFSFKVPIAKKVVYDSVDIYAAYTNRSFWQAFDNKDSIPFRETNHEPELWAELHTDINVFNFNLHKVLLGFNHQSNGQSGDLSRGWNRLFVQGFLQKDNSFASFKTWQRFDEKDEFDNSFDYAKYMGDYEIELGYKSNKHTYGIILRNRYALNKYGAIQFDYTYPLTKKIKGYVQWFSGYGDSLIDMDYQHNKIGLGIVLADRI